MTTVVVGPAVVDTIRTAVRAVMPSVRVDLEDLVRIASVSGDAARAEDLRRSAEVTAAMLARSGLSEVRVVPVAGGPAVIAGRPGRPGAPTVLLYAHHDVQPAGDPRAWDSDPFEPTERDGRLFGRGAADDKAGIAVHLAALRALGADAGVGIVVLVEGEEEIGSPGLESLLDEHAEALTADVAVVADAANWDVGRPALTTSLRGAVLCTVEVSTLEHAVHSGLWGGVVPDAATVMVRMLASLHDEVGDVAVHGLVRGAAPPLDHSDDRVAREAGMLPGVAQLGSGSVADRLWRRPSVTITGLDAVPTTEAANALMPSVRARLSLRLAPGDEPDGAVRLLREHLESHLPWGARLSMTVHERTAPVELDCSGPAHAIAYDALRAAWDGVDPVRVGVGGSIPFVAAYRRRHPHAEILVTGIEDPYTGAHGPNEGLHLGDFERACVAETVLLTSLAHRIGQFK